MMMMLGLCRFIIATLAAIVASQALISAVFQIVYQAITQVRLNASRLSIHPTLGFSFEAPR